MKFTDGYWLTRDGFDVVHPVHAFEAEKTDTGISVLAPTKKIDERSDGLNLPVITLDFSAPMNDVLVVKIIHHAGVRQTGPWFDIKNDSTNTDFNVTDDRITYQSGKLSVQISREAPWAMDFFGDEVYLTGSSSKSIGYVQDEEGRSFVHEQLTLGVGELVYGMGERFSAFVKNGQVVDIWNRDGGTSSDQAYKNIPFYITNRGYGVFVNETGPVSFEVASEKVNRVQMSVPGESLEYLVVYGPTPADILRKYTALTGRPSLPPAWSFGLWLTTSFTTSYDEKTVLSFIDGMAERNLPLHVFHFDCFWMKAFRWCDFLWDSETFDDVASLIRNLHERDIKISLWINPYIAQRSAIFPEAVEKGYLIRKTNGDVWQTDLWQAGMGIVDFTNPEAASWYLSKLKPLLDMGVDSFKTDFGERIPTDVVYYDGSDPVKMHNYYAYLYNQKVYSLLAEHGDSRPVLYARSATAGSQKFPVHWGGDCFSTFESMAESLRGGLSLALCGFGFWSHDIGGFEGHPDPAVFKRWIAFGLLSSHSRLHGSTSYRVPWLIDEESVDVLRHFTNLKCRLMPYIFSKALQSVEEGLPVMRPMMFEYPLDRGCDYLERQYMLGDKLLVAPVMQESGIVEYYLPQGIWTDLLGTRQIMGPTWVKEEHDFLSIPLWVRENTVLPVGSVKDKPDYDYRCGLVLELYEIAEGSDTVISVTDENGNGRLEFRVICADSFITVSRTGVVPGKTWSVLAVNRTIIKCEGGVRESHDRGSLITGDSDVIRFPYGEK